MSSLAGLPIRCVCSGSLLCQGFSTLTNLVVFKCFTCEGEVHVRRQMADESQTAYLEAVRVAGFRKLGPKAMALKLMDSK